MDTMSNTKNTHTVHTFTLGGHLGTEARAVTVTATRTSGRLLEIVGLPEHTRKEVSVRVRSALAASGINLTELNPTGGFRVVVSDLKVTQPSALDLPIALAILGTDVDGLFVAGELGLDGSVRAVRGVLQATELTTTLMRGVLVPEDNVDEAQAAGQGQVQVYGLHHLTALDHALAAPADRRFSRAKQPYPVDFSDVRGQDEVVDECVHAAADYLAGRDRGLVLVGPPGTGKTMIARRLPGILPSLSPDQKREITRYYSALGLARHGLIQERPFRAPHHTISSAVLVGGGASPRPGELQLAAHGVLFLDELHEFTRGAIAALAGALREMDVASRPLVVVAANPCPCGWLSSRRVPGARTCTCPSSTVERWTRRLEEYCSLLGVDKRRAVHVVPVPLDTLRDSSPAENNDTLRARVWSVLREELTQMTQTQNEGGV